MNDEPTGADAGRAAGTLAASLMEIWQTRDIHASDLVPDANGVLRRGDTALEQATIGTWAAHLATEGGDAAGPPQGIELGAVLGEGGMGIVRAGVQVALRRTVAVKELRAGRTNPAAVASLLREAWVSGNLEHPNIVPVHALVAGDDSPRLVMKRVEGTAWSDVLAARRTPLDDLDQHLAILGNVCRAVHFAHARGVLHLDLKPANVMLGRFGEIYLVDWGIAAGLDDGGPPWLPKASAIARVCGTPSSLAPELACGDGPGIGVHTDVYGLGTVLHEILTNTPRHAGGELQEVLVRAFESAPVTYPPSVPRGLAAIANRATARHPDDRFPDAEALRQALDAFLAHRGATRLSDDALARLATIEGIVGAAPAGARAPAEDAALERLFIECRYAFEQALTAWPESDEARAGKRRLLELVIDDAIAGRQWQRAAAHLAELADPPRELVARVAALHEELAQREASRQALERLGHETDVNFNRLSRSAFAAITGTLWVVWNGTAAWLVKGPLAPLGYDVLIGSVAATLVIYAGALWVFRRTLLTTALNRSILALFGAWFCMVLLVFVGAWVADDPPLVAVTSSYKIYLAFCLAMTIFVDRRGILAAILVAPFTVFGPSYPELAFELVAAIGALVGFTFAWLWRRPARSPFQARTP